MLKNLLPIALAAGLLFFGWQAYSEAKPESRDKRVYAELKPYIPYKIEKRVGGLSISNTLNDNIEKPPATQVYHRLDELEKLWGKRYLKLEKNQLFVLDDNNKTIKTILLQNEGELSYVKSFFEK